MKSIAMFSLPLLLGNIAQQLYNTVDAIVVGNYSAYGDTALAAVNLGGTIINLMLALFMGIATGAGIVIAQYFGAKDGEGLSQSMGTTITLTLIVTFITTSLGVLVSRPLLTLLGAGNENPMLLNMADEYLRIIFWGMIGGAFYNILAGALRAVGDSFMPLLFMLVCTVLNVILDIWFVQAFPDEQAAAAVALATILAQSVSAVLCLLRLLNMKKIVVVKLRHLKMNMDIAKRIVSLGVPSGMTQMIFSLANILVTSLTVSLGEKVVTAVSIIMRVDGFAMMPNFTFGLAATTFTGQNVGARRIDRVHKGAKDTLILGLGVSVFMTACLLIFGEGLMRLFTQTEEIVTLGASMLRLMAAGYVAFSVSQVLGGVMRGAGDTIVPMWISILTTVVVRMPIAYLWAYFTKSPAYPNGDPSCLYWSLLISWLFGAAITVLAYRKGRWKRKLESSYAVMASPGTDDDAALAARVAAGELAASDGSAADTATQVLPDDMPCGTARGLRPVWTDDGAPAEPQGENSGADNGADDSAKAKPQDADSRTDSRADDSVPTNPQGADSRAGNGAQADPQGADSRADSRADNGADDSAKANPQDADSRADNGAKAKPQDESNGADDGAPAEPQGENSGADNGADDSAKANPQGENNGADSRAQAESEGGAEQ